jgi:hypothetical protein
MFKGGSTQMGSLVPNSAKTTEILLSELNKKVRDLTCVVSNLDGLNKSNNQQFISTPGSTWSLFSQLSGTQKFQSVSFTVIGAAGDTADLTMGANTITLPVGFSASYAGPQNDFIVVGGAAYIVFSTIII